MQKLNYTNRKKTEHNVSDEAEQKVFTHNHVFFLLTRTYTHTHTFTLFTLKRLLFKTLSNQVFGRHLVETARVKFFCTAIFC